VGETAFDQIDTPNSEVCVALPVCDELSGLAIVLSRVQPAASILRMGKESVAAGQTLLRDSTIRPTIQVARSFIR